MTPGRKLLRIAGVIGAIALLALPGLAAAQDDGKPVKPKTRKVQPVSKKTFERLNKAHEALEKDQFAAALGEMNELAKDGKLNGHEQALMYQTYGYIYSGQERYGKAAEAFEKSLATGELSPGGELNMRYNLGQLYMANEQYRKAIATLRAWFEEAENPQPDPYFLLAQAYVQVDELKNALSWAKQGLARAKEPRESWLQLALALYFENKDFPNVVRLLETMVARFPSKKYWIQLYAAYGELGEEKKAHAAFEIAYRQGFLTADKELRQLAQLHLYHEVPYKAARLLSSEIEARRIARDRESLEMLANAWIAAREFDKALAPLEEAAKRSGDGKLYLRLGQVHMENEDWGKAAATLRSAIDKGGLDDPGQVHLLIGICNVNAEKLGSARSAFNSAAGFPRTRDAARQWLAHIDQEEARIAALQEDADQLTDGQEE